MKHLIFLVFLFQALCLRAETPDLASFDLPGSPSIAKDSVKINVLNKIAYDYTSRNSFLAEKYSNLALESSKRIGYAKGMAESYKILGLAFLGQARYPDALDNLLDALKISEEMNDDAQKANVLNDIGYFYHAIRKYQKAIGYYDQAASLNKSLHHEQNEIDCRENVAECYISLNQFVTAKELVDILLKSARALNYQAGIADAYQNLGTIYAAYSKFDKALPYYLKAVPIYAAINDDMNRLTTLNKVGKLYMQREEPTKAREYIQYAIDQSSRIGSADIELTGYLYLSKIDSMAGNFQGAMANFRRFTTLKDSIESAGKALKVEEIQSNFLLKSQNKHISLLQKNMDRQDLKMKGKNTLIYIFLIFFVVVGFLSVVLTYFYRQKKDAVLKLEAKKEELEMLNGVKDKLFSVISHDLRSPLANLEAILSLMETGDLSTEEVVMLASQLTQNVQDTSNMLDNLLQWSKSQMQGIRPKHEKANLGLLVNDIIFFYRNQAEKKAITVRTFISEPSSTFADVEMMKLVVRNLLANAIKFTPTGGMINVEIKSTLQNVIVSIKDSGLGISENNKQRLFSNTSFSTAGTQDEKGTGLGLLLCRDFVEKNNGKIWVESQLGKGSIFSFSLPLILDPDAVKASIRSKFI